MKFDKDPYSLDCMMPQEVLDVLFYAAEKYLGSAGELSAGWQDEGAGAPWAMIARELNKCASGIEKKLAEQDLASLGRKEIK